MSEREDIATLVELVEAVKDEKTGGYDVAFDIQPQSERYRSTTMFNPFWTVVKVESNNPVSSLNGEWWFFADGVVMQVL